MRYRVVGQPVQQAFTTNMLTLTYNVAEQHARRFAPQHVLLEQPPLASRST